MRVRVLAMAALLAFSVAAMAQGKEGLVNGRTTGLRANAKGTVARPWISGISHIAVYTSDPAATEHYYRDVIGAVRLPDPENEHGVRYAFSDSQYVEVLPLPEGAGVNRLDHTAWNTYNAEGLREFLAAKGWKVPTKVEEKSDGSLRFTVRDPEENLVEFVQLSKKSSSLSAPDAVGTHIIHVGFLVHSREKEDVFYRDLLGFKPYWFGGMEEGKLDWVSQQAPGGHDWLEYMLVGDSSSSGIPADMSQRQLGILDHLSIGVRSVEDAYAFLKGKSRMDGVRCDAHTQIGKDGKGQYNLYDPDGIRLELMNFHATQKPCCSPFTAPDPEK